MENTTVQSELEKFQEAMKKQGGISKLGVSALGVRDKNRVHKGFGSRIPRLKKEKNTYYQALIPIDLSLPFNPEVGYEDEHFNEMVNWRPDRTWSEAVKTLKMFYSMPEHQEAYEAVLDTLGVDEWDVSDYSHITEQDRKIFNEFKVPRVYTFWSVEINSPSFDKMKKGYRVPFKRDEDGLPFIVDENGKKTVLSGASYPIYMRMAELFGLIANKKYNEWEKSHSADSEETKKKKKLDFFGESPITYDKPLNATLMLMEPLDDTEPTGLADYDAGKASKLMRTHKFNEKIENTLKDIAGGKFRKQDVYDDFYEISIDVHGEEDAMTRGKNTNYTIATNPLKHCDDKDAFLEGCSKAVNSLEESEKVIRRCVARHEIDSAVTATLADAIKIDKKIEDVLRYLNDAEILKYADVLKFIYGNSIAARVLEAQKNSGVVIASDEPKEDISNLLGDETKSLNAAPGIDTVDELDDFSDDE